MPVASARWLVRDLDLAATLDSGQAFRWQPSGDAWEGVVRGRWVQLRQLGRELEATTLQAAGGWAWIREYLDLDLDLGGVYDTFPADAGLRSAVAAHRGLRLLRQEPWECLATFILSSTKRIVQIREVVQRLCERLGDPVETPLERGRMWAFPTPAQVVAAGERALRGCRMGFRAPHLLEAARAVREGRLDLAALAHCPLEEARGRLMALKGVGPKIADCVLLFSCGQRQAFPVDVWVARALRTAYFRGRNVPLPRLRAFAKDRFGPWAGYAQQYLFHSARNRS